MGIDMQLPAEVVPDAPKDTPDGWTIRVWPNATEATMTYHVDTAEEARRVIEKQIAGWAVRKVEIYGP